MKRRKLSEDDLALWRKVTERTEKLDLKSLFVPEVDAEPPAPQNLKKAKSVVLGKPRGSDRRKPDVLIPSIADQVSNAPVQMDKKAFGRLKRGKMSPEGRLDLHGMTNQSENFLSLQRIPPYFSLLKNLMLFQ